MRAIARIAAIALATATMSGMASLGAVYVAMAAEPGNDLGKSVVQVLLLRTAVGLALGWVALVAGVVCVNRMVVRTRSRIVAALLMIGLVAAMALVSSRLTWWMFAGGIPLIGFLMILAAGSPPPSRNRDGVWMPNRVVKGGGIALYALFVVGLSEGIARMVFFVPALADRLWANESLSWQRFWVGRHRDDQQLEFAFDVYDSTKGWMGRPGLRDVVAYTDQRLSTNSLGLRGSRDPVEAGARERPRVMILGDSFTFGDEVSDQDVYSRILQELLPDAEILNFGMHGYGHDQMLILLREEGPRLSPDVVILGYVRPDEDRNVLHFRDYAKPMFRIDGEGLRLTHSPVPTPAEILRDDWRRPRLIDICAVIRQRATARSGAWQAHIKEVTRRLLDEIVATTRAIGAEPIIAYFPVGAEIRSLTAPSTKTFLADYCERDPAIRFVSTWERFADRRAEGVQFKTVGHWRRPGHETVATALADYLIESGLLE